MLAVCRKPPLLTKDFEGSPDVSLGEVAFASVPFVGFLNGFICVGGAFTSRYPMYG